MYSSELITSLNTFSFNFDVTTPIVFVTWFQNGKI